MNVQGRGYGLAEGSTSTRLVWCAGTATPASTGTATGTGAARVQLQLQLQVAVRAQVQVWQEEGVFSFGNCGPHQEANQVAHRLGLEHAGGGGAHQVGKVSCGGERVAHRSIRDLRDAQRGGEHRARLRGIGAEPSNDRSEGGGLVERVDNMQKPSHGCLPVTSGVGEGDGEGDVGQQPIGDAVRLVVDFIWARGRWVRGVRSSEE